ncbi:MAG: hypothetical protein ACEPOZ_16695 [Marinifilaceae bacterium]
MNFEKLLKVLLYLVGLHSFLVGIGLIVLPVSSMSQFGFEVMGGKFFSAQGGVFHLVMSLAYVWAAMNVQKYQILILFSIAAKFIATVFLFSYFFLMEYIWMVLLSGIGDFLMGILMLFLYAKANKSWQVE